MVFEPFNLCVNRSEEMSRAMLPDPSQPQVAKVMWLRMVQSRLQKPLVMTIVGAHRAHTQKRQQSATQPNAPVVPLFILHFSCLWHK